MDDKLNKLIMPIATYLESGRIQKEFLFENRTSEYKSENEFIAIAEGRELPIYIFTYNIEMTQFIYTDLMINPDQVEVIDKSIPARHHAQFISQQIADEGRLNNHKFELNDKDFLKLIRHHQIATVSYSEEQSAEAAAGLGSHDIYIIGQPEEIEEISEKENTQ